MMKVRLIANGSYSWERWIRRWGLSFLVDDDILFDAFGDARVLMGNLRRFKVDVGQIRQVVVSHEHWDHVEGLRPLLAQRPGIKVYLPHHADRVLKDNIRAWGGDVVEVGGAVRLKDGVHVSGEIVGRYADKDMAEQALVLETGKGLVVVAGCAHPGIVTIVQGISQAFSKPVYGVIGGFHLKNRTTEEIGVEAARLQAAGVDMVVPLHCTGARAEKIFQQVFGSGLILLREGQEIELEGMMSPMTNKRDFDKEAAGWDAPPRVKLAEDVSGAILKQLTLTPDMDMLDFGCGTGLVSFPFHGRVRSITGVDSSQGMLDALEKKACSRQIRNIRTIHADVTKDEGSWGHFHVIVSSMALHHIEDTRHILEKFYQTLLPGGQIAIADLDEEGGRFHDNNDGVFHFGFNRGQLGRLFKEAGFVDVHFTSAARMNRPGPDGEDRFFDIFLVTARKG